MLLPLLIAAIFLVGISASLAKAHANLQHDIKDRAEVRKAKQANEELQAYRQAEADSGKAQKQHRIEPTLDLGSKSESASDGGIPFQGGSDPMSDAEMPQQAAPAETDPEPKRERQSMAYEPLTPAQAAVARRLDGLDQPISSPNVAHMDDYRGRPPIIDDEVELMAEVAQAEAMAEAEPSEEELAALYSDVMPPLR